MGLDHGGKRASARARCEHPSRVHGTPAWQHLRGCYGAFLVKAAGQHCNFKVGVFDRKVLSCRYSHGGLPRPPSMTAQATALRPRQTQGDSVFVDTMIHQPSASRRHLRLGLGRGGRLPSRPYSACVRWPGNCLKETASPRRGAL